MQNIDGLSTFLLGSNDRHPASGDSPGSELQPNCANLLLHETEPHEFHFQLYHSESACGRSAGKCGSMLPFLFLFLFSFNLKKIPPVIFSKIFDRALRQSFDHFLALHYTCNDIMFIFL